MPSAVVDGLTPDGLVQRRRTVPRGSGPAADGIELDDDGLPRRVRQANLDPRLRAPADKPAETASPRPPEQVRNLMSSLQRGTTRGRLAATEGNQDTPIPTQRRPAEPMAEGPDARAAIADAATVIFPVVQNHPEPGAPGSPYAPGNAARPPEKPDKDA
jgi:hypothetical protein